MNVQNIQPAINQLRKKLVERFGQGIQLFLFGSVARGDFDSESDIDILVLLPFNITNSLEENIFDIAYDVELEYDVVFGITAYQADFWHTQKARIMPLFEEIQKEGIAV